MSRMTEFSNTYKPFKYPWAMSYASRHEDIHWTENEIELGDDLQQWNNGAISDTEKAYVLQIMRLFTQTDCQVGQNYCELFIPYFKNNEIRCGLLATAAREGIHQRAYALFTDTLGLPETIYSEFLDYDSMVDKVEYMQNNSMATKTDAAKAIAQTVINEGMSLFSSFVMLMNFQRHSKLIGLCKITEWSLRDETDHVEYMSQVFKTFLEEEGISPSILHKEVLTMLTKALELEDSFIDDAFKLAGDAGIKGLSASEMKQYIRFIADRRLNMLGYPSEYNEDNPFPWLDWLLSEGHTNFFEQRVSDYSVGGLKGDWTY